MKRRNFISGGLAAILASRRAPAFCVAMRNGMMRPSEPPTPQLPYDAEVEYLESTGANRMSGQYIDTGVVPLLTDIFTIRFKFVSVSPGGYGAFGCSDNYFGIYANYVAEIWYGGTRYRSKVSTANENTVVFDYPEIYVNGVSVVSNPEITATPSSTLRLFCATPIYHGNYKIYNASLVRNGVELFDFIPVRFTNELGQSEGAMYDNVSKQLFRNAGTGAFTIGPDK